MFDLWHSCSPAVVSRWNHTPSVADWKPQKMSGYVKTLYFPRGCLKHLCANGPRLWVFSRFSSMLRVMMKQMYPPVIWQAGKSLINGGFTGKLYKWKMFQQSMFYQRVPRESRTVHNVLSHTHAVPWCPLCMQDFKKRRRRLCLKANVLLESRIVIAEKIEM